MRLIPIAAAAMLLLAVAACGTETVAGAPEPVSAGAGASAAAGSSAAAAATAVDPCEAASAPCTYMGQADIDGDGVLDQIGLGVGPDRAAILRVAVRGQVQELAMPPQNGSLAFTKVEDIYVGAFEMTRGTGADIVLYLVPEAGSADQFVVASWLGGEGLGWLPPIPETAVLSGIAASDVWMLLTQRGETNEISCKGDGVVTFERVWAPNNQGFVQPKGDTRDIHHFTFEGGHWIAGTTQNVPDVYQGLADARTEAFQCSDETVPAE